MSGKHKATLFHPAFPDTSVEVEGADRINAYKGSGWLDSKPADTKTEDSPKAAPSATTASAK